MDSPEDGLEVQPRRGYRAGRSTRSTMRIRSAAWHMAGSSFDDLQALLPVSMRMGDLRRQIYRFLRMMVVASQQDALSLSRGPQDLDPANQQFGHAEMNALHDVFVSGVVQTASPGSAQASSQRSRSPQVADLTTVIEDPLLQRPLAPPRSRGIYEQRPLNPQELQDIYGIGSRLVMMQGWEEVNRSTPLSNDRPSRSRVGVGFAGIGSSSRSSTQIDAGSSSSRASATPVDAAGDGTVDRWGTTSVQLFSNAGADVNREVCPICFEEFGAFEVVEYACTHHLHRACHDCLVADAVADNVSPTCPLCRRVVVVMTQAHAFADLWTDWTGCLSPQFIGEGILRASGSPATWRQLQAHSRLPRFARLMRPDLRSLAEPWVRAFLRNRVYDRRSTLEDAFTTFTVIDDVHVGCMVQAVLSPSWYINRPQGEVAYHGTSMAPLYAILCQGLQRWPDTRKQASNGEQISGVFVHKHGTRHKARNYMKYFMFSGGFIVGVLLQCRVADPPQRRTFPPDQWCLPENCVQVEVVHFHFVAFEDVLPGHLYIYGEWESVQGAPPW